MSTLPPSTVQLPSASTSPSTHFVCLYTFYSYIFAAIFAQRSLYSTSTLIYVHSSVDVQWSLQCYSYIFAAIFVYITYIHAYIHLWTHSDVSTLHLHSSVDVQRSLQCYSYIFAAIFVYIFVHPCLHSSVDAQRHLYSTPTLICGWTAVSTVLQLHFRGHFRVHFRTRRL